MAKDNVKRIVQGMVYDGYDLKDIEIALQLSSNGEIELNYKARDIISRVISSVTNEIGDITEDDAKRMALCAVSEIQTYQSPIDELQAYVFSSSEIDPETVKIILGKMDGVSEESVRVILSNCGFSYADINALFASFGTTSHM